MKLQYIAKRAANILLNPFQLTAVTKRDAQEMKKRNCMNRLALAKKNGFSPSVILDGGAYHGLWTVQAASLFPGAKFILVEPNPSLKPIIQKNISQIAPAPVIVQAALGSAVGKATLNLWRSADADPGASLLSHVSGPASQNIDVDVTTIDEICRGNGLSPDLIKLDLQGGELAALKGATLALQTCECLVVEFSCLKAYIDRTTPRDLLGFMGDQDFCLYDIVGLADRPYDGALMGGDFIFVKNSSALRSYPGWE